MNNRGSGNNRFLWIITKGGLIIQRPNILEPNGPSPLSKRWTDTIFIITLESYKKIGQIWRFLGYLLPVAFGSYEGNINLDKTDGNKMIKCAIEKKKKNKHRGRSKLVKCLANTVSFRWPWNLFLSIVSPKLHSVSITRCVLFMEYTLNMLPSKDIHEYCGCAFVSTSGHVNLTYISTHHRNGDKALALLQYPFMWPQQ